MASAFLRVVNLSVSAGYIILAVMVLRLALRRAPKWMSCALWALVALRLVCPFSLESALSLLPSGEAVGPAVLEMEAAAPETVFIHTGFEAVDRPANAALHAAAKQARPQERAEPQAAATAPAPARRASALPTLLSAASVVWLVGAAAMVLYGAGSYLRLRRRVRTAVLWKEDLWQCETVDAPFVLGIVKPRVYLPFYMDPVAAAQVIAHERAHIRRHDQITKVFAWLLLSAYWFDPLVWAAYALLCRDIELACDERVVRDMSTEARQRYARALLNWGVDKPNLAACPLAFGEVGLKERIKTVMKYKKPARWAALLAVALIAASGVCLLTSPMAEAVAPFAESAPFTASADAHGENTDSASAPAPAASGLYWDTPESQFVTNMVNVGLAPYVEPDETPEPFPILTVRPRAVTADEAKALAEAVFGDAPIYEYTEAQTKQELAETIAGWERRLSSIDVVKEEVTGDDDEAARAYIEEFTPLLEAYKAAYETATDEIEPQPADWTFHPDSYYSDQGWQAMGGTFSSVWDFIMVTSERDGLPYKLRAENYDGDDPEDKNIRIYTVTVLPDGRNEVWDSLSSAAPLSREAVDGLCAQARDILTAAGLDRYAVASADLSAGRITALPVYGGKPLLQTSTVATNPDDPNYGGVNTLEEGVTFEFEGDRLYILTYDTPQDVVNSQDVDALLSLRDALAASDLSFMDSLRWQLGYARTPIGDGTGDLTLVPAYVCASRSLPGCSVAVSAVDGALLTGAVPTEAMFPALIGGETPAGEAEAPAPEGPGSADVPSTPIPVPQIKDLEVRWGVDGPINYVESGYFSLPAGQSIDLCAIWYPQVIFATPEWTVDDESIVTVQPDETGIQCHCEMVGASGTETVLHVRVNEKQEDIRITVA